MYLHVIILILDVTLAKSYLTEISRKHKLLLEPFSYPESLMMLEEEVELEQIS